MKTARVVAVLALGAASLPARADDAACAAVLAAVVKQTSVPTHQKITIESAAAPGKPIQSEMIHLGDTLYMLIRGQWTNRPYDAAKQAEEARQAMQKGEHSCTRLRTETVDGKPAELYSVESKTPSGGSESRIWISSMSGLPLRQTSTVAQGATRMKHEASFDYDNVKAP